MQSCSKCTELLRTHRFLQRRQYRLSHKLTEAFRALNLAEFERHSGMLSLTQSALDRLRSETEDHEAQTGHDPFSEASDPSSPPEASKIDPPLSSLEPEDDVALLVQPVGEPGPANVHFCEEKHRLIDKLIAAMGKVSRLQAEQLRAVIDGDPDFARFEALVHAAQQEKDDAKYAVMAHISAHHCENA